MSNYTDEQISHILGAYTGFMIMKGFVRELPLPEILESIDDFKREYLDKTDITEAMARGRVMATVLGDVAPQIIEDMVNKTKNTKDN